MQDRCNARIIAVVNNDQFPIGEALFAHAFDRRIQILRPAHGQHDYAYRAMGRRGDWWLDFGGHGRWVIARPMRLPSWPRNRPALPTRTSASTKRYVWWNSTLA